MLKKIDYKAFSSCLFGLVTLIPMLSSCEMETTNNGELDGFWHLESVDTIATGGTCDYSNRKVFWGVQHKLIAVRNFDSNAASNGFYFRFSQTGDSLVLSSPYANHWHQDSGENGGDLPMILVTPEMRDLGVNYLEEHYCKDALSSSKMILSNGEYRLRFTKF